MPTIIEPDQLEEQIANGHARRMGNIENYFGILQRRQLYKSFATVVKFNNKVNNNQLLYHSLRSLMLKYPILASTIVDSDYSDISIPRPIHDYISILPKITLDDMIYKLPDEIKKLKGAQLLNELNEISIPYAQGTPLWRLAFLDDYTMVYLTNHCLSDGITAKYLIEDLENEFELNSKLQFSDLDYLKENIINYSIDKTKIAKLPPPMDTLVSYTPPVSYIFTFAFNAIIMKLFSFTKNTIKREDKHIYRELHITPEESLTIKNNLKSHSQEKITITPYIQTAWLNAQYEAGLFNDSWFQISDVSLPCNARQFLPSGIDSDQFKYGANTSGSHKFYFPVKQFNWENLIYLNTYTKYLFKTKTFLYNMGIITLDLITKSRNLDKIVLDAYIGQNRRNSLISNVGLFHDSTNEKFKIQDVIFAQNAGSLVFNFSLCVASCKQGGINIVITMAENATSEKMFDDIVAKFHENLLSSDQL